MRESEDGEHRDVREDRAGEREQEKERVRETESVVASAIVRERERDTCYTQRNLRVTF